MSFQPGILFATVSEQICSTFLQNLTWKLPYRVLWNCSLRPLLNSLGIALISFLYFYSLTTYVIIFLPDSDNRPLQSLVPCLTPVVLTRCLSEDIKLRPFTWVYSSTQIPPKRKPREKRYINLGPRPTFWNTDLGYLIQGVSVVISLKILWHTSFTIGENF